MSSEEKIWFAARITTVSQAAEAVEFALNEADALGTEIDILGRRELPEIIKIAGYFAEKPDEENLKFQISDALRIYGFAADAVKEISVEEVENRDWLAEWKKHWRPTETEKFIVAPTWQEIESADKIVIRIEPSMAFGTGTHETTRLCLRAIEENYQSGMSFLDVGTGTGILAIAAAKSQVPSSKPQDAGDNSSTRDLKLETWNLIVGCDTDEDSIKIAKENAALNGVGKIEFYVGSISETTPEFDFVCANLTADVIVPLLSLLIEKTKRILVLSGILKEQENLIVEELKKFQISDFKIETDGEWISATINKKS